MATEDFAPKEKEEWLKIAQFYWKVTPLEDEYEGNLQYGASKKDTNVNSKKDMNVNTIRSSNANIVPASSANTIPASSVLEMQWDTESDLKSDTGDNSDITGDELKMIQKQEREKQI